jgi:hypothetical protein
MRGVDCCILKRLCIARRMFFCPLPFALCPACPVLSFPVLCARQRCPSAGAFACFALCPSPFVPRPLPCPSLKAGFASRGLRLFVFFSCLSFPVLSFPVLCARQRCPSAGGFASFAPCPWPLPCPSFRPVLPCCPVRPSALRGIFDGFGGL